MPSGTLTTHTQEKKMSDNKKSGYELRTDLLGMAQGILADKVSRQFDNEHLKTDVSQMKPVEPYTTEDIIAEAEKLYAFIQKK
tara:strand:+ start:270 stop:518 length:249 start_codon:yes stop_codon:yes gene_type:complete